MDNILLNVNNLHASINGKEILKGINLTIRQGEVLRKEYSVGSTYRQPGIYSDRGQRGFSWQGLTEPITGRQKP